MRARRPPLRAHLELLVGVEVRVGVVQAHHHAHQHQVRLHVVQEGAAEYVAGHALLQRPAVRVLDVALLEGLLGHLPDLLHAQPVGLLVLAGTQVELLDHRLRARPPAPLREERLAAQQLDTRRVGVQRRAVLADARVLGGDLVQEVRALKVRTERRGRPCALHLLHELNRLRRK